MSEYRDFGWKEGTTYAHGYLYDDLKSLLNDKNKGKILDIGCGNGFIANSLISEGFDVYGVDASESGIKVAKKQNKDRFFIQDFSSESLPKKLQSINFDTIISTEVIEHLYDPRKYIRLCHDISMKKKGGN